MGRNDEEEEEEKTTTLCADYKTYLLQTGSISDPV